MLARCLGHAHEIVPIAHGCRRRNQRRLGEILRDLGHNTRLHP